jgi:hypothetical protein
MTVVRRWVSLERRSSYSVGQRVVACNSVVVLAFYLPHAASNVDDPCFGESLRIPR